VGTRSTSTDRIIEAMKVMNETTSTSRARWSDRGENGEAVEPAAVVPHPAG
jgi:hypothetical protein